MTVLTRLRLRARRLRARVVGFPYDDKFSVTVMLVLTVVVPGAFIASSRTSEVRDLARSLEQSGTSVVASRSTVDVARRGPRSSSWVIEGVRVRLPGVAGDVRLVGTSSPTLGEHRDDEIGYARLKNLPAYRPPLRVRYRVIGTTVRAMAEADVNRRARSRTPEILVGVGWAAAALWALGWVIVALLVIDARATSRSQAADGA
jgi:hypothetical protein